MITEPNDKNTQNSNNFQPQHKIDYSSTHIPTQDMIETHTHKYKVMNNTYFHYIG